MRRLLTVEDTFLIATRGLIVVPAPLLEEVRGPGDVAVELRLADGTRRAATLTLLQAFICRQRTPRVPLPPESPVPRDPPGGAETVLRPARPRRLSAGASSPVGGDVRGCGFLPGQAGGVSLCSAGSLFRRG
jgi:hypothetical protein